MFLRFTILTILLLSLASCGSKKATVPVKLRIFQSAITSGASVTGGILLMGKSADGQSSFRMGVPNAQNEVSLSLTKGKWQFAAVAWSGGEGIMTGTNRCAYTGYLDLNDSEVSVNFDLYMARCLESFDDKNFSEPNFLQGDGLFLVFNPVVCFATSTSYLTIGNCLSGGNESDLNGFRIIYKQEQKGDISGAIMPLISKCFNMTSGGYPRIPLTAANEGTPLGFTLQLYHASDCSSPSPVEYDFSDGALNGKVINTSIAAFVHDSISNFFFVNPGANHLSYIPNATAVNFYPSNSYLYNAYYIISPMITYNISGAVPSTAVEMCVTESTCTSGDWKTVGPSGTITTDGTTGMHTIKLFYRNAAGQVSPVPKTFDTILDPITMSFSNNGFTFDSTNLTLRLEWTIQSYNPHLFASSEIQICGTPSCAAGDIYYQDNTYANPSTANYVTQPGYLIKTMPAANYYARLKIFDVFNRYTTIEWSTITISAPITSPP